MTADRWAEVERLCLAALEQDEAARAAFLDRKCLGDAALRREVESLLAGQPAAEALLAVPAIERAAFALAGGDGLPAAGGESAGGLTPPTREHFAQGTHLGPYQIDRLIAAGGMGDVYRAVDARLDRHVAVKVLPAEFAAAPAPLERFRQEARAVAALNHPNILAIHDIGASPATPPGASGGDAGPPTPRVHYLVTELLEGETLRERIARGPIPVGGAIDLALQVVRALSAAHARHIVHRDLKPSNVFLTTSGQSKLLDFGIAKILAPGGLVDRDRATASIPTAETGPRMGTVGYSSPEQVRGLPTDGRSDIFSFGAVLYEMLAGRRAFEHDTAADTLSAILTRDPPPLEETCRAAPAALRTLVSRCLAKRPEERFQTAEALALALEEVSARLARGRRARRAIGVAAALLVLTGAGGGLYVYQLRQGAHRTAPNVATSRHPRTTIAVLPLQNRSGDTAYAYVAGGLHDELIGQLSRVSSLRVISRTSVAAYESTTTPLAQIADELDAGTIVEGSVQVSGGRLRVSVRIVDSATNQVLWTEPFDRTLDDAFAVQTEIARRIVGAVGAALSEDEQGRVVRAPTTNAEAYRLYLQGQTYMNRPGLLEVNQRIAQQFYQRALALDPAFALAHAALSYVNGLIYWLRLDVSPARVASQRQHAEEALRLAPDLPEAHAAMAVVHYWAERDTRRALGEFRIAVNGMPNDADTVAWLGYVNRRLGNWEEAFAAFEKATRLGPRNADLYWDLGGETFTLAHRYSQAVAAYDRALGLAPDLHYAGIRRGLAYVLWQGNTKPLGESLRNLPENAELGSGGSVAGQRAALLLLERDAEGLLRITEGGRAPDFVGHVYYLPASLYAAWAHQLRGEREAARKAFEQAVARLDAAERELPDDWRVHAARGLALAGVGRRDAALAEASWLQQSNVYRGDVHFGSMVAEARAQILAQTGSTDAALDELERLVPGPSWMSVHTLRLDPRWDPIREHPRYQALLKANGL